MPTNRPINDNSDLYDVTGRLFKNAVDIIDEEFGDGYAIKNPALVASVIQLQENVCTNSESFANIN